MLDVAWLYNRLATPPRCIVGQTLRRRQSGKQDRVARTAHPDPNFVEANGERLPFPAAQFDIVLAFTVFSSILDQSIGKRIATEITRVLATGGVIVWYDVRSTLTRGR
jgi:ubiquinone/menaquinone biosynthesis C-methylase UbiE